MLARRPILRKETDKNEIYIYVCIFLHLYVNIKNIPGGNRSKARSGTELGMLFLDGWSGKTSLKKGHWSRDLTCAGANLQIPGRAF